MLADFLGLLGPIETGERAGMADYDLIIKGGTVVTAADTSGNESDASNEADAAAATAPGKAG